MGLCDRGLRQEFPFTLGAGWGDRRHWLLGEGQARRQHGMEAWERAQSPVNLIRVEKEDTARRALQVGRWTGGTAGGEVSLRQVLGRRRGPGMSSTEARASFPVKAPPQPR